MVIGLRNDNIGLRDGHLRALGRLGLIVVDHSLNLAAINSEATQILTFPSVPEPTPRLDSWLTRKLRTCLVDPQSAYPNGFVDHFKSARRTYHCRCFPLTLNSKIDAPNHPARILTLERSSNGPAKLAEICARFSLTQREQEAVKLLFEGLTSKEIADRMKISPNTVKGFLRFVMAKMGVSTRSGILGKIVTGSLLGLGN